MHLLGLSLKLSTRAWREVPLSQVFSAISLSVLLVLIAFLVEMETAFDPVVHRLKQESVITVYRNVDSEKSLEALEKEITDVLSEPMGAQAMSHELSRIRKIEHRDQAGFLKRLEETYPELSAEIRSLSEDGRSILPEYVQFSGKVNPVAIEKLRRISGVEEVDSSRSRYQKLAGTFEGIQWLIRFLCVGLAIALMTGLIQLSRMNRNVFQDLERELEFWGATAFGSRFPVVIAGATVGLLGGFIAAGAWELVGPRVFVELRHFSPLLEGLQSTGHYMSASLAAVGVLAGATLSGLSVLFKASSLARFEAR